MLGCDFQSPFSRNTDMCFRCGTGSGTGSAAGSALHLADSILSASLPPHCKDSSKKYNALFSRRSSRRLRRTERQTLMSWLLLAGFGPASLLLQYAGYWKALMFILYVAEFVELSYVSVFLCDLLGFFFFICEMCAARQNLFRNEMEFLYTY